MGVAGWIVLAFLLGLVFGRLTASSSGSGAGRASGDLSPSLPSARTTMASAPVSPTSVATTIEAPVSASESDVASLLSNLQGSYKVVLLDRWPNTINTIKAIRDVIRVDLKGAKDLADNTPCELMQVPSLEEGNRVLQRFQGVASVRLEGGSSTTLPPELERMLDEFARSTAARVTRTV